MTSGGPAAPKAFVPRHPSRGRRSLVAPGRGRNIDETPPDPAALIGRYQELLRHSADVITLVDDAGTVEYQSPSIERVLGYGQGALVGDSVFDYVHREDRDRIQREFQAAIEAQEDSVRTVEYRFRRADGSWVWLESVATDQPAAGGGYVVNSRDVTERREARAALERERERYEAVVEGVNDAIAIVRDGTVAYANPQCHELLGWPADGLVGEAFLSVVAPEDQERAADRYARHVDPETPDPPERYQLRFETAAGDGRVGEVHATAIEYEDEPAVLVAIRDVTDRAASEARLEDRTEQLEALNRVVRHDIRNDMAVILGWAELLEEHVEEAGREHLDRILTSAEHVVELTDNARDFVEALTAGEAANLRPVALRPTILQELERRRESYPHADVAAEGELPDVSVKANEMLSSVFTNLINNAVQHHDGDAPTVRVSAAVDGGAVEVRVADDGPGIPEELRPRLFGKGEKGLESAGSGIGLYLVRTLVEGYGGGVRVEDHRPRGSVFVVRLPLAD